jgi:hypothetical protein
MIITVMKSSDLRLVGFADAVQLNLEDEMGGLCGTRKGIVSDSKLRLESPGERNLVRPGQPIFLGYLRTVSVSRLYSIG